MKITIDGQHYNNCLLYQNEDHSSQHLLVIPINRKDTTALSTNRNDIDVFLSNDGKHFYKLSFLGHNSHRIPLGVRPILEMSSALLSKGCDKQEGIYLKLYPPANLLAYQLVYPIISFYAVSYTHLTLPTKRIV